MSVQFYTREVGMTAGGMTTVAGLGALFAGAPVVIPAVLFSAGVSGGLYAYKATEENYDSYKCIEQMWVNAVSAFVSEEVSSTHKLGTKLLGKSFIGSLADKALGQVAGAFIQSVLKAEELNAQKLMYKAMSSCIETYTATELNQKLTLPADSLERGAREFLIGMGSAATAKISYNVLNQQNFSVGVQEASLLQGASGIVNVLHSALS